MDSPSEEAFDRVTRLASRLLKTPTALLSLVDPERQFFKSAFGIDEPWKSARQTPLTHSFCQHVVTTEAPLVIDDARLDERVANNLAVTEIGVVAYIGVPVRSPDGQTLGSLCAIDGQPRKWSSDEEAVLRDLADIIESEILLREEAREIGKLAEANAILVREYHHRVKNALSVASAIVTLSAREGKSTADVVSLSRNRLNALARAHDALILRSDDVDLKDLAMKLMAPYFPQGIDPDIEGPTVQLHHQQVTPLCLFLHELATNSAKHGAFHEGGTVVLRWSVPEFGQLRVEWAECAATIKAGDRGRGFGTQLLDIAAHQLGGRYNAAWSEGSLTATLEFPATLLQPTAES
jgi:two-component sensor histidine kinase